MDASGNFDPSMTVPDFRAPMIYDSEMTETLEEVDLGKFFNDALAPEPQPSTTSTLEESFLGPAVDSTTGIAGGHLDFFSDQDLHSAFDSPNSHKPGLPIPISLDLTRQPTPPAKPDSISPTSSSMDLSSDSSHGHERKDSDSFRGLKRKISSVSSSTVARDALAESPSMSEYDGDDLMMRGSCSTSILPDPLLRAEQSSAPRYTAVAHARAAQGMLETQEEMENALFDFASAANSPGLIAINSTLNTSSPLPLERQASKSPPGIAPSRTTLTTHNIGVSPSMPVTPIIDVPNRARTAQHRNRRSLASNFSTAPSSVTSCSAEVSREVSPSSQGMIFSSQTSPTAYFHHGGPSAPSSLTVTGAMLDIQDPFMIKPEARPMTTYFPASASQTQKDAKMMSAQAWAQSASSASQSITRPKRDTTPRLIIHGLPLKSRVETQIRTVLTLTVLPPGVTKLHLPSYTIAKFKYLKGAPSSASDTLELHTMLVSSTAMEDPDKFAKAMAGAARKDASNARIIDLADKSYEKAQLPDEEKHQCGSDDDFCKDGGEVMICLLCQNRERKRIQRKKNKKPAEEEIWQRDEGKRVIMFNQDELQQWMTPTDLHAKKALDEITGQTSLYVPEGSMQVDLDMRIACYCRHHKEKLGYRVIFTIKDHEGRIYAQSITPSITTTDDHKNNDRHNGRSTAASPTANGVLPPSVQSHAAAMPTGGSFPMGPRGVYPINTHTADPRLSRSHMDLASLHRQPQPFQRAYASPYDTPTSNYRTPFHSQPSSASQTPQTRSRQASPATDQAHPSKKRRSCGNVRVPESLVMTRVEGPTTQTPRPTASASTGGSSSIPSIASNTINHHHHHHHPNTPANISLGKMSEHRQTQSSSSMASGAGEYQANGDDRSLSLENLNLAGSAFSGPPSRQRSGASSPAGPSQTHTNPELPVNGIGHRGPGRQIYEQPLSRPQHNGYTNGHGNDYHQEPLNGRSNGASHYPSPHPPAANTVHSVAQPTAPVRPPPIIHKAVPGEGPRMGGMEVTILGSGFSQGLEVMFGDVRATTTTYWSDACLCCLVPPAVRAGPVELFFRHDQHLQQAQLYGNSAAPRQPVFFRYLDDDGTELLRMAMSVINHRVTGQLGDIRDFTLQIVSNGQGTWDLLPPGENQFNEDGRHQGHVTRFDPTAIEVADTEGVLLKCLDLIDFTESAHQPRLNLRGATGQTMLHLACSLGFHRFVAGLLARGVNVDPRDKGGFTPMHFAALHDRPEIVRRLVFGGADPTLRSLQGYTPADLATSEQSLQSIHRIQHLSDSRHVSSTLGTRRVRSAVSLSSLLLSSNNARGRQTGLNMGLIEFEDSDDDQAYYDQQEEMVQERQAFSRSRSRRSSRASIVVDAVDHLSMTPMEVGPSDSRVTGAGAASMAAWRNQLTAQLHHLQQTVQWNMPNLPQIPTLPPLPQLPQLPDYQMYLPNPMARRINALVPPRGSSPSGTRADSTKSAREGEYKWSELFFKSAPPPAYDEIYPPTDTATATSKEVFRNKTSGKKREDDISTVASSSSAPTASIGSLKVRLGRSPLSREEQDALRAAHAKKIKKIKSDRNLFFIWIPLLVILVITMLRNIVPEVLLTLTKAYGHFQHRDIGRINEEV